VKITETSLKRIIREELERLAEVTEPKTLAAYFKGKGQRLPSLAVRRGIAGKLGLDPKTIGSASGNTALLNKLLQLDRRDAGASKSIKDVKPPEKKDNNDDKSQVAQDEYDKQPVEQRAIRLTKYILLAYDILGSVIDSTLQGSYGQNAKDATEKWARLYPNLGGDLGLIHMPNASSLQAMRRPALKLPEGADKVYGKQMLRYAFAIITDTSNISADRFGDMIFSALVGGSKTAVFDRNIKRLPAIIRDIEKKFKNDRRRDRYVRKQIDANAESPFAPFAPKTGKVTFQAIKDNIYGLYGGPGMSTDLATRSKMVAKQFISQAKAANRAIKEDEEAAKLLYNRGVHPTGKGAQAYLSKK